MNEAANAQSTGTPEQNTVAQPQNQLFRQEAVAGQLNRLDGEVILAQPLPSRILGALAVLIVIIGLIFLSTATYARMERVTGWIVPEGGLIRVVARQGGIIETINVEEGDEVSINQPLATFRLSTAFGDGNAGILIAEQLKAEAEASAAHAEATQAQLLAEQEQVALRRDAVSQELDEARAGLSALETRLGLLRDNVKRVQQLASHGVTTKKGLEEARLAELNARQELSQARASVLNYERQISDLDARYHVIPLEIEASIAQARIAQATLAQRQTEAAVQNKYIVGATVAGRVVAVPVSQGQDMAPGNMIATITPAGSELQAELFVPSRAIGFISLGQEVRLMYQAFPYQKFGTAQGTIQQISKTILGPGDISVAGVELREPVFRVKVALNTQNIAAYGHEMPIQPGMLLDADVIVDRRTLLEWLFDPLYAVGRRG